MHVVIIVIWILETIQHNNQDLRDRNHARRTYIHLFVWALTYCCSTIAYKCRTISLSQYTFNQFWKHFYLFSLAHSYMNVFFSFLAHLNLGCKRLFSTFVDFLSYYMYFSFGCWLSSFHFTSCLFALFLPRIALFFYFGMMCIVECTPAISIRSW